MCQGCRTSVADGSVHKSCCTKPTAPLTASTGLDEEHIAKNGFLCQELRRRRIGIQIHNQATLHGRLTGSRMCRLNVMGNMGKPSSRIIGRMKQGWHIGAGYCTERRQAAFWIVLIPLIPLQRRILLQEFRNHFLTFTDQEQINKIGNWFGIEKGRRSTGHDQGMLRSPFYGPQRDMRGGKNIKNMKVVRFKRNREGQNLKIGQGPLRLQ